MSNFFVFVRVDSPPDSAKQCASFVELSPSTHICANMQERQSLCSVCILAYRTPGKQCCFLGKQQCLGLILQLQFARQAHILLKSSFLDGLGTASGIHNIAGFTHVFEK